MSIETIKSGLASFAPMEKPQPVVQPAPTGGEGNKKGFGEILVDAVKDVDSMQHKADDQIADLITGKGNVTTHEAMVALEKADIAFQLMNQVRSKIVRAYEEVLRTQV